MSLPPTSGTSSSGVPGRHMYIAATSSPAAALVLVHERLRAVGIEDHVVVDERRVHEVLDAGDAVADRAEAGRLGDRRIGPLRQAQQRDRDQVLRRRLLFGRDTVDPAEVDRLRRVVRHRWGEVGDVVVGAIFRAATAVPSVHGSSPALWIAPAMLVMGCTVVGVIIAGRGGIVMGGSPASVDAPWAWVPAATMPNTASPPTNTDVATSNVRATVAPAEPSRAGRVRSDHAAATAAASASPAAIASAVWTGSAVSSPSTNEMPDVFATA